MSELDDYYANAGFDGSLGFGKKPVLLIIDFVMAYLEPDSQLYAGVESELAVNERLVAAARTAGVLVIWTNVTYMPGGADGGHFFRKVPALKAFEKGSPLGAFPPSLQPRDDEMIVTKKYPSAFFGTELAATLTAMGVDCCVLTGLSTSGCVRASTLDALQNGFIPLVVPDACGDRDQGVHDANIFDLKAKYADMLNIEDAEAYFARVAS